MRTSHLIATTSKGFFRYLLIFACVLFWKVSGANTYTVTTTTDFPISGAGISVNSATGVISGGTGNGQITLRSAIAAANSVAGPHTINVPAGTFTLTIAGTGEGLSPAMINIGDLDVTANNVTIHGAGMNSTIINQTSGIDRVFDVNVNFIPDFNFTIDNLTISGGREQTGNGGGGMFTGSSNNLGTITVTNVKFDNNQAFTAMGFLGNGFGGGGLQHQGGDLILSGCIFNNNSTTKSGGGLCAFGFRNLPIAPPIVVNTITITNCTFTSNQCSGASGGGAIDVFAFNLGAPNVTISGCNFSSNSSTASPGGAISNESSNSFLTEKCTFLNNTSATSGGGVSVGGGGGSTIRFCRFVGNTAANGNGVFVSGSTLDANNNWWGVNTNPVGSIAGSTGTGVLALTKWLQLKTTASPTTICNTPAGLGNTSLVTTSYLTNSSNEAITLSNLAVLIGLPVTWSSSLGSVSGQQGTIQANGTATGTFTSNGTGGNATVNTQVDNVPNTDLTARATIVVHTIPVVTDPSNFTSCVGGTATFSSTVTGVPAPTIQWRIGTTVLVNGVQASGSTISGQGTNTLTITNVRPGDAATNYNVRASNECGEDISANTTLFVNLVTGGTVGSDQTICSGGDPAAFSESVASTGSGALTYQWQSSTTGCGGTFTNIGGATAATFDPPSGLTVTTTYRRITISTLNGVPCTANSNCVTVTVNNVTGGTVATAQTICSGGDPTAFTESAVSTGSGALTYQWQSSTTGCGGTFSDIGSATGITYDPPAGLLVTTSYRRVTTSTLSGVLCTANSNCITVTVNDVTSGTVGSNQTICSGGDPAAFSESAASTGTGALTYQWQSSTTGCDGTFSNIGSATATTYDPPAGLLVTTTYRRITTSTQNGVPCTAISNCVTVTVNNVTGGTVGSDQTICSGGDPAAFSESAPSTGSGALTYQWQSSTTGCGGTFSNIGSATSATYDPPAGVSVTTNYRRVTTSTLNGIPCTANSNCVTVTVRIVTGGTIAASQTICSGGDPAAFTESVSSTGDGVLTYQWQSSTSDCSTGFTDIDGATNATYDPPSGLTVTTYYRRVTTSTANGLACTANSNCLTVTITAIPTITAPTVTQPTCATPTGTIVVNATGDGTLEYSVDGGTNWFASNTFSGLAPDNYNIAVRYQSNHSCSSLYDGNPVVLNAATGCCTPPVVSDPTVTQPTCATPTGTIVVNATGDGTLEYSVDGGTNWFASNTFSGLAPDNYNIAVRLQSNHACSSVYDGNPVVLNPATGCCTPPVVSDPTVTQPTCATPTGTIVINATGGGTLEYSVNGGTTWFASNTFSGLAPDNYNIAVRLQSNHACSSVYDGNPVVLNPATGCCTPPAISDPTVTQPTCATPTGTIVINATGGGTLEYSVNGGTTWFASNTFSGLAPDNYNIAVRLQSNHACASVYDGNPVVLNPATGCCTPPAISDPTVTQPTCATPTGTIVINATGGGTLEYSVNGGTTWFASNTFSGLSPDNYNIAVRFQSNHSCSSVYDGNPIVLNPATGCTTASVGDRVWNDSNGDGVQDAAETGLNGITVELLNSSNVVIATTVTGANGIYGFSGLGAGTYSVRVVSSTLPAGFAQTYDLDGTATAHIATFSVSAGQTRTDVDFGYDQSCAPTVNAPTVTQPTCAVPTGKIVVNATGSGTLEYRLNSGSWQSSNTFSGLAPGNYNISVRLKYSTTCIGTYSGNPVVLNPASGCCVAPIVNAPTVTQPTCAVPTGKIVVNATGSGTLEYRLNSGSWQSSNTFSGLAPGNYNISVRLKYNTTCIGTYSGNPVVLNPASGCCVAPVVNAPTVTQPTCAVPTGKIVVNATGSGTLEYKLNSGSWQSSNTFSGLAPGNYNISVRLKNNTSCTSTYVGNPVVLNPATGCCVAPTVNTPTVTQPTCAVSTGKIVVNASGSGTLEYKLNSGNWQTSNTFSGLAPGNYNISVRLKNNTSCVTNYSGNPVVLITSTACGPVDPNKCYRIVNRNSGKALSIENCSSGENKDAEQQSSSNCMTWKFVLVQTGYYKIVNVSSGKSLEVKYGSTSDYANIVQGSYSGQSYEKWSLTAIGSYFVIKAKHSGKAMSVKNASTSNGADVVQKGTGSNSNEQWSIVEIACPNNPKEINVTSKDPSVVSSEETLSVTVSPNPGIDFFDLTVKSDDKTTPVAVRILDVSGRVISTRQKVNFGGTIRVAADTWVGGVYFAEVTQGSQRKVVKLIKAN